MVSEVQSVLLVLTLGVKEVVGGVVTAPLSSLQPPHVVKT